MAEGAEYLVKVDGEGASLAVVGRASYLNCRGAGDFFNFLVRKKCKKVSLNFAKCTGMDSTFLGAVAGLALGLRGIGGELTLENLEGNNLRIVRNLGIHRLAKTGNSPAAGNAKAIPCGAAAKSDILDAHKNLVKADPSNAKKFEDVVSYLKREADGE